MDMKEIGLLRTVVTPPRQVNSLRVELQYTTSRALISVLYRFYYRTRIWIQRFYYRTISHTRPRIPSTMQWVAQYTGAHSMTRSCTRAAWPWYTTNVHIAQVPRARSLPVKKVQAKQAQVWQTSQKYILGQQAHTQTSTAVPHGKVHTKMTSRLTCVERTQP